MILKGQYAIVTGAAGGIGRAIALDLAREGAGVMAVDIKQDELNRTLKVVRDEGFRIEGLEVNLSDPKQTAGMVQKSIEQFGRLDIIVNAAGVLNTTPLVDLGEEDWDLVMAVNLRAVFVACKYAAREMVRQKSGRIINISSTAGKIGAPGQGAYCASKSGVLGLTQVLAIELGPYGITANAICPGNTETDMMRAVLTFRAQSRGLTFEELAKGILDKTPLRRFGRPEDIAHTVLFLASPAAAYITGQAINVCGGRTANMS
jgi:NAD(P)-dependent dehydrogenase (short-subunit alcohol dehydrogenase family)